VVSPFGWITLFHFDRSNGTISDARVRMSDPDRMAWGLAFSPDESKLYYTTSNQGSLRQLDLSAGSWADILASEVILGTILPDIWKDLRLGPDNKIYVTKAQHEFLSLISEPNLPGVACAFIDEAVPLTAVCSFGLPNLVCSYAYHNTQQNCGTTTTGIAALQL